MDQMVKSCHLQLEIGRSKEYHLPPDEAKKSGASIIDFVVRSDVVAKRTWARHAHHDFAVQSVFSLFFTYKSGLTQLVEDFQYLGEFLALEKDEIDSLVVRQWNWKYELFKRPDNVFPFSIAKIAGQHDDQDFDTQIQEFLLESSCLDVGYESSEKQLELRQHLNYRQISSFNVDGLSFDGGCKDGEFRLLIPGGLLFISSKLGFGLKHCQIYYLKSSRKLQIVLKDMVQQSSVVISFENKKDFTAWLSGLRLAKHAGQLRNCYNNLASARLTPVEMQGPSLATNFKMFSKFGKLRLLSPNEKKEKNSGSGAIQIPDQLRAESGLSSSLPPSQSLTKLKHRGSGSSSVTTSSSHAMVTGSSSPGSRCSSKNSLLSTSISSSALHPTSPTKNGSSVPTSLSSRWSLGSHPGGNSQHQQPSCSSRLFSIFDEKKFKPDTGSILNDNDDVEDIGEVVEMDDIFAAVDCNDGEFKIVTDPAKIEEIKKEEIRRRRKQGRIQQELSKEPWFTRRTSDQVAELLKVQGEDGAFLIRSSGYRASDNPEAETFVLLLFFNDQVESYRIFQRAMLGQIVFYFANCGKLVFPSLRSLVEFHHFNLGSLPCLLREYPRLP